MLTVPKPKALQSPSHPAGGEGDAIPAHRGNTAVVAAGPQYGQPRSRSSSPGRGPAPTMVAWGGYMQQPHQMQAPSHHAVPYVPHHHASDSRDVVPGAGDANPPSCTMYVRPIPDAMEEVGLMEMFSPFGAVVATKILRNFDGSSRAAGFVEVCATAIVCHSCCCPCVNIRLSHILTDCT